MTKRRRIENRPVPRRKKRDLSGTAQALRLRRIVQLLILFASGAKESVGSLAVRFQVSVRTIHRDIRLLRDGGFPVECAEDGTGYSLRRDQRLQIPQLNPQELCALMLVLGALRKNAGGQLAVLVSAIEKVLAASIVDFREKAFRTIAGMHPQADFREIEQDLQRVIGLLSPKQQILDLASPN